MELIFKQIEATDRFVGYAKGKYSSSDDSEKIVETTEKELNDLVPDSFEGDWKDNRAYFKLESGEIVFDESYKPDGGS